jgi:hypothetical protein
MLTTTMTIAQAARPSPDLGRPLVKRASSCASL